MLVRLRRTLGPIERRGEESCLDPRHAARRLPACAALALVVFSTAEHALAANGFNQFGFGTESVALGGADIALATGALSVNINPANLAAVRGLRIDQSAGVAYGHHVGHADPLGNDTFVDNELAFVVDGAAARHFEQHDVTLALGLFGQGGAGARYKALDTPFGTTDRLESIFRIAKLAGGFGWQVNDRLAVGASLGFIYSDIKQQVLPNTSAPGFFGYEFDGAVATDFSIAAGVTYKASERLTLGANFRSKSQLDLDGSDITFNMAAIGLGEVRYRDVALEGLALPLELGVGLTFSPTEAHLFAVDLTWLNWDDAVNSTRLVARRPRDARAPPVLDLRGRLAMRDQLVVAVGYAFKPNNRWTLRAGWNYARAPIRDEDLTPTLSPVAEHFLTLGAGYRFNDKLTGSFSLEHELPRTIRYTNPSSPFGQDNTLYVGYTALRLMLSLSL